MYVTEEQWGFNEIAQVYIVVKKDYLYVFKNHNNFVSRAKVPDTKQVPFSVLNGQVSKIKNDDHE